MVSSASVRFALSAAVVALLHCSAMRDGVDAFGALAPSEAEGMTGQKATGSYNRGNLVSALAGGKWYEVTILDTSFGSKLVEVKFPASPGGKKFDTKVEEYSTSDTDTIRPYAKGGRAWARRSPTGAWAAVTVTEVNLTSTWGDDDEAFVKFHYGEGLWIPVSDTLLLQPGDAKGLLAVQDALIDANGLLQVQDAKLMD